MLTAALKSVRRSFLQAFLPCRDIMAMAIIHSPHWLQMTFSRWKEALRKYYIPVRNYVAPSRDLVPNNYQMRRPSEAVPHHGSPSRLPSPPEPLARQEAQSFEWPVVVPLPTHCVRWTLGAGTGKVFLSFYFIFLSVILTYPSNICHPVLKEGSGHLSCYLSRLPF